MGLDSLLGLEPKGSPPNAKATQKDLLFSVCFSVVLLGELAEKLIREQNLHKEASRLSNPFTGLFSDIVKIIFAI